MKRFQWKWIFTGSKTCCTIWRPFWFAMVAILNPKWSPKIKKSTYLGKIWFPSRLWCCELISISWEPCYDPSDHIISCFPIDSIFYHKDILFFSDSKECQTTRFVNRQCHTQTIHLSSELMIFWEGKVWRYKREVISSGKSKKDTQCNVNNKFKKDKRTNIDLQNNTHQYWTTRTPQKQESTQVSRKGSSFCFTKVCSEIN